MSINSIYHRRLVDLTNRLGSLPEQQLLARWQPELDAFLKPADRLLLAGQVTLEVGLEDRLALKINLRSRNLGTAAPLLALIRQSPRLLPWAPLILGDHLRFHCGLHLAPNHISRKLYVHPREAGPLAPLLGDTLFNSAVQEVKPLLLGISDQQHMSMYFQSPDNHWVDLLRQELSLADWSGIHPRPWQQIRFDGAELERGKTAVELTPLPAPILARLISHYPFPCFRYLVGLRDLRSGSIGRDATRGHFTLYATVN